eukprot:1374445-Pleurochrysis_carterae.AAC.1
MCIRDSPHLPQAAARILSRVPSSVTKPESRSFLVLLLLAPVCFMCHSLLLCASASLCMSAIWFAWSGDVEYSIQLEINEMRATGRGGGERDDGDWEERVALALGVNLGDIKMQQRSRHPKEWTSRYVAGAEVTLGRLARCLVARVGFLSH